MRINIKRNELVSFNVEGFQAFIKETEVTTRNPATLIKIFIIILNQKNNTYLRLEVNA